MRQRSQSLNLSPVRATGYRWQAGARLVLALLGVGPGLAGLAQAELLERTYRRSFPVPSEIVMVDAARGMIEVVAGSPGSEVVFEVNEQVQREAKPVEKVAVDGTSPAQQAGFERIFARLEPRFEAGAKKVRLTVADSQAVVFDWDPALRMVIIIKVTVPPGVSLAVQNVSAGVSVSTAYKGNLQVRSDSGSVYAQRIEGDFLVRTDSGSITVAEVTGRAELRSDSGLVLAGVLAGPSSLRTSNGSIEVQQPRGELKIRGDHADIIVGLSAPPPPLIDVRTSAGVITLNIDANLPVTIDAATKFLGKVRMRGLAPVVREGGPDRSMLGADFNGGGPLVKLRTFGGVVALVGRTPLDG